MINKIIALNIRTTPNEMKLREDITKTCGDKFQIVFIDSNDLWLEVKTSQVRIMSTAGEIDFNDSFVFIRSRKKDSAFVALLCHLFTLKGVKYTDTGNEYQSDFTDKSFAIPRLAFHGLPVPDSIIISHTALVEGVLSIENSFKYPCVVKGSGARGASVRVVNNRKELLDFSEVINRKPSLITIQSIIPNNYDIRALFFDDHCLGVIRRTRKADEPLLNNVSKGAVAEIDRLSEDELQLCRRAMSVSFLNFAGIDFIRTPEGLVFLELNKTPQLGGVRSVIPDLSVGQGLLSLLSKK